MRYLMLGMLWFGLSGPVVAWATPITPDDPHIETVFGVLVIHGHVEQPSPLAATGVEVLDPLFEKDHDPYSFWYTQVRLQKEAEMAALPAVAPQQAATPPPWQYTPSDQTYTPKTDWTFQRKLHRYTPKPSSAFAYTPRNEWTYHPKKFRSWYVYG